ncbi:MAG: dihydropteroate synthase [Candidatus Omnitrophica bacterium]|nr:dihydropteroate synthase [Candidatus Omnitrophota bacterium]
MRVLTISNQEELKKIMRDIGVDPYGIKLMLPKAKMYLVKLNSLSNISANILKQEMLSLGGEVALARGALTGKVKKTGCLIMATLAQLDRLNEKLSKQPFGLGGLSRELSTAVKNYQKEKFVLNLGNYKLKLGKRSYIMAILNLTPDSFSHDGIYSLGSIAHISQIEARARKLVEDGADIIDLGGESSRPQAKPVSVKEELSRVIPVIKILAKKIKVPISIDTRKPEIAKAALDNGALMVNDISGLRDRRMAKIVSRYNAGVVIMHMQGEPGSMQKNPRYASLMDEIIGYLSCAIKEALDTGIARDKIVIDPGIGFGKTLDHNLEILRKLKELKVLGQPILIGTSRKAFIGKILGSKVNERIFGTLSSCILAVKNGANILRVHDIKPIKQALAVLDSVER